MSDKSFKKSEFKRTVDLGKTERGETTDLIRVWRESSGEERAISLGDINGGLIGDYVPYTGAVEDVDLGEKGISAGYVKYDTTPTATPTDQGTTYWDVDDETLAVVMNGTILKVGEDQYYPVKNQTGSSIPKGTAVQFNGTLGASGRLLIAPFIANGSLPSTRFMGVTSEAIANGADGKVMWFGRIRGINTNAFNDGDILYASTTVAGGFQTTVPVAPNNIIEVCAVVHKGVNNGIIFVRPQFIASGSDANKVSYNVADSRNATEKNQARINIGSTSATPQVIATAGAIDNLAITSNHLVFTGASVVLSGIVAGLDGEEVTILNASGTNLTILAESALSTAGNRLNIGLIVPNLSILRIKYRTTTNRWFSENVGVNDGRYVRRDVADTKTGALTIVGQSTFALEVQGGLRALGALSNTDAQSMHIIRNGVDSAGVTQFFGTNGGSGRQHFAFYGSGDVEYISFGNGWVSSGVPTARFVNAVLLQGNASASVRSANSNFLTRRDELYLNYSQTVATAGTINDLAINADCKLLILTGATDLTGVVFVDNTRLLRIEARGGNRIIRHESASSIAANRFSIGADLTINAGEVYQFIYTDSRWRRVL